jgi:hypothetical protein
MLLCVGARIPDDKISAMTRQKRNRVSAFVAEPAETAEFDFTLEEYARRASATPGLSAHVRQLRNRNQGISRWLVLAIFAGAAVALALVQFAVR